MFGAAGIPALSATAAAAPPPAAAQSAPASAAEPDLSALFTDPASARAIGRRYLAQFPERPSRSRLLADLDLADQRAGPASRAEWIEWLGQAQQRDFSQGHTVIVNRWVLSRTEAALCALSALS